MVENWLDHIIPSIIVHIPFYGTDDNTIGVAGGILVTGKAVVGQVKKDGMPYITATHDKNNPRSGNVMKTNHHFVEKL